MKSLSKNQIIDLILRQNLDKHRLKVLAKSGFVQINLDGFEYILDVLLDAPKDFLIDIYNENTKHLKPIL